MSSFLPAQVIRAKRNGESLSDIAIHRFVEGIGSGEVSEAQIGAFTMACFLNGMTPQETAALTLAMRASGEVVDCPVADWIPGPSLKNIRQVAPATRMSA